MCSPPVLPILNSRCNFLLKRFFWQLRAMLSGAQRPPPPLLDSGNAPTFTPWSGEQADRDKISQVGCGVWGVGCELWGVAFQMAIICFVLLV
jgi:hypothetical protein